MDIENRCKSKVANLLLKDQRSGKAYTVCVSHEDGEKALNDKTFARALLEYVKNETEEVYTIHEPEMPIIVMYNSDHEAFEVDMNTDGAEASAINNDDSQAVMDGSTSFRWTHEAILLLIEEYRKEEQEMYSGRKSHKRAWNEIAETMQSKGHEVTARQCQTRFDTMKRTYKSITNNNKSGNSRRQWRYFELMKGLLGQKLYIMPVSTMSSTGVETSRISESSTSSINDVDLPSTSTGKRAYKRKADNLTCLEKIEEERNRKMDKIIDRMDKMDEKLLTFMETVQKYIDRL